MRRRRRRRRPTWTPQSAASSRCIQRRRRARCRVRDRSASGCGYGRSRSACRQREDGLSARLTQPPSASRVNHTLPWQPPLITTLMSYRPAPWSCQLQKKMLWFVLADRGEARGRCAKYRPQAPHRGPRPRRDAAFDGSHFSGRLPSAEDGGLRRIGAGNWPRRPGEHATLYRCGKSRRRWSCSTFLAGEAGAGATLAGFAASTVHSVWSAAQAGCIEGRPPVGSA